MKPTLDLDNPLINEALVIYKAQMISALGLPQQVEKAVLPIYFPQKRITKPEQIGSGVVVRIDAEYFVFSASHIFDDIGEYALLVGMGDGSELVSLCGDRFSSKKGPSGTHRDDPIDASVFHIKSGITESIKNAAITLHDFDLQQSAMPKLVYMAAGFRVKNSNTAGNRTDGKRECFPSIEYGVVEYSLLNINRASHIALAYENQILMDGHWKTSPTPKGFSGGAIIKAEGIDIAHPYQVSPLARQLLTAITIAQIREKGGKPGVLIGTRIGIHLGLIEKYLPGLLDIYKRIQ